MPHCSFLTLHTEWLTLTRDVRRSHHKQRDNGTGHFVARPHVSTQIQVSKQETTRRVKKAVAGGGGGEEGRRNETQGKVGK